jgi:hypothetical protein
MGCEAAVVFLTLESGWGLLLIDVGLSKIVALEQKLAPWALAQA